MKIEKLIPPDNEHQIKSHWKYTDKVYISCVCITYNQKNYICDAIDGFLAQETEYRFEIIIHDDLSTDGTRDILLEYKIKYPSLIKLVLQETNQYSLGKKITPLAVEHAEGEYIAICEGDDFWIDKFKLQKQIIELETNKDINLVISKAKSLYPDNSTLDFCDLGHTKKIIPFESCILGPKIDYFPTASFFLRKKIFNDLPDWFYTEAPVGDYYIQLFAAKYNGVIYLPDITSIYRRNAIGSWSSTQSSSGFIQIKKRIICNVLLRKILPRYYHYHLTQRMINQYLFYFILNFIYNKNKINSFSFLARLFIFHPSIIYPALKYVLKKIFNK